MMGRTPARVSTWDRAPRRNRPGRNGTVTTMHAGRKPKEDRTQVRHRIAVLDFDDIPDIPFDGPKLPPRWIARPGDVAERKVPWPRSTARWWEKIRRMPHTKDWADTDWEWAFATAELHARIAEGRGSFVELRQRERRMGTTAEARRDMRMRYVKPSAASEREDAGEVAAVAPVTQIDAYREMYA
jgi:hypothetical protein